MRDSFGKPKLGSKPGWLALIVVGVVFSALLGARLGWFHKETLPEPGLGKLPEKEIWISIRHGERKIGYARRRLHPGQNGYFLSDMSFLRINTMGLAQDIHFHTTANLNPDMSLVDFSFTLQSGAFDFNAHGRVENDLLTVSIGDAPVKIPAGAPLYLASSLLDAAWISGLEPNQTRTFSVFDPATMGQRPVHVVLLGTETVEVMGAPREAHRLSVDFLGATQTAWIDSEGTVVREEGFMGMTLTRVTEKEALHGLTPSQDLTQAASVDAGQTIPDAQGIKQLRLRLSGIDPGRLSLDGGRQRLEGDVLTISRETRHDRGKLSETERAEHLKPTPFIQSDHPAIEQAAAQIISPGDAPGVRADKLVSWVHEHIEKRPVLSVPNALETLKNREGDCNEHAVLLAALARASGIPAQVEAGIVHMTGRFYYHAWNVLYLDRWVTADSLMGQIPADVTHIRFVRGEPSKQIDLMAVIGKLKVEILELVR